MTQTSAAPGTTSSVRGPITRVLICDDNRDNMLTLGVLLRSEGYLVHLAGNGIEALSHAEAFQFDVALLDLRMPGRSGFDVARSLQRRYGGRCPILIAVTAENTSETKAQAESVGFRHFVGKPYSPKALLGLIGSLDERS